MKKQNKWLDNFGKADNANESTVSFSENFVGEGYDTEGRNYSPAWGGQFQMGGSIPGSVGFTYARTINPAPSEGKYAKKTMPSAQNGIQQDATRVSSNVSDKLWGIQRELDAQNLSDDSFREKYNMSLHQFKMRDSEYANAIKRQMDLRRQTDPNYSELNLPRTDVRSKNYQGNPNLGFIPGTSKGESRAAIEDAFLATTTATAPLLPVNTAKIAKGAQQLGKYLTEETALRNAYKLNPYAFKPNPEAYYRMIGDKGLDDLVESGIVRSNQSTFYKDKNPFFSKSAPIDGRYSKSVVPGGEYEGTHMLEVQGNNEIGNRFAKNRWADAAPDPNIFVARDKIGINNPNLKIYEKDWLKGYKEIPKPTSSVDDVSKGFKSEIDWAKWNKEIPENKALMQEYNAIEQQAKTNGTWMKNPDGTAFQGTPEQFVQQNSENFKKAFGNSKLVNPDGSPTIQYHGSAKKFDTFDESKFQLGDAGYSGQGIYTTPSKTTANSYSTSSAKFHSGEIEPTVYELYGQANNPVSSSQLIKEGKGRDIFNFHRKRNWKGELTPEESLMEYDAAISDQLPNVQNIRPWHDAREIVFPRNTQLKSAIGNNGMFDMTNPNIYKGIVPAGIATGLSLEQKQNGGEMKFYQEGLDWKPKSMQDGGVQKTSEEIEKEKIKKARETAFKTIQPSSYDDLKNMGRWMFDVQRETYDDPRSEEFWRHYLQQPGDLQYLKPSQYKPTISKNKDVTYYSVDDELEKAIFDSYKDKLELKEIKQAKESDISKKYNKDTLQNFIISNPGLGDRNPSGSIARALGSFTVSKGKDDKGEYISYYDTYDFPDWIQNKVKGEPYEIYGRIYYPKQKQGGVIKDNRGQWAHPGEITEIDSPYITMKNVPYPVLGISDTGDAQLMYPEEDYVFDGDKVTEIPMGRFGINNLDAQPIKKLNQLLNFTNDPDNTNWLDKY
jgi:hypothetical protein